MKTAGYFEPEHELAKERRHRPKNKRKLARLEEEKIAPCSIYCTLCETTMHCLYHEFCLHLAFSEAYVLAQRTHVLPRDERRHTSALRPNQSSTWLRHVHTHERVDFPSRGLSSFPSPCDSRHCTRATTITELGCVFAVHFKSGRFVNTLSAPSCGFCWCFCCWPYHPQALLIREREFTVEFASDRPTVRQLRVCVFHARSHISAKNHFHSVCVFCTSVVCAVCAWLS